ncbi:unnamed protein product, partial [marine sediment metagenome]
KRNFVLDKMTGTQTIKQKMEQMNIDACDEDITKAMRYVKSKEKGTISDTRLMDFLKQQ